MLPDGSIKNKGFVVVPVPPVKIVPSSFSAGVDAAQFAPKMLAAETSLTALISGTLAESRPSPSVPELMFVALVVCAAFLVRWVLADRAARRKALADDDTGA